MPLTREQFDSLRQRGLTTEQIIKFEQGYKPQPVKKESGFLKQVISDPIKTLLVKPADRTAELVGRTGIFGKNIKAGYEQMSDAGESRTFGGITVEPQKAFGTGGGRQILGDVAKSGSYLYGAGGPVFGSNILGGGIKSSVSTALGGQVLNTAKNLAQTSAVSGGLYSFGDAIVDAENSSGDVAFKTLFGAGVGGATGLALGLAAPLVVKTAGSVKKFNNINELNSELTGLNNTTLKPTSKQIEKWERQGVDPIKTYTEIFATETPQVDKNNRFVRESVKDFVDRVDEVYRPGAEGFNTILRNSPEVNNLSKMEKEALDMIADEDLTPNQRLQAKAKIQNEISALRSEVSQNGKILGEDNIPVALTDNYKDNFWANTKYFGDESTSVSNATNRALGRVFAKNIEDVVTDVNVKQFNKQLQQYIVLKDFLESKAGALAGEGGKMTRLFSRVIGSVVGAKGGPVGSMIGSITGDKLAQIWINPANSPARWLILKQLQKLSPAERKTLEQEANQIIQKMYEKRMGTLSLPAGNPSNIPIILREASSIEAPAKQIMNQSMVETQPLNQSNIAEATISPTTIENTKNSIEGTVTNKNLNSNQSGRVSRGTVIAGATVSSLIASGAAGYKKISDYLKIKYKRNSGTQIEADKPYQTINTTTYKVVADPEYLKLRDSIAYRETRGESQPYTAINLNTDGTSDYGKYQVNEQTLKTYAEKYIGKQMTPQEFLADPDAQEKFFDSWVKRMKELGVKNPNTFLALWHKGWSDISTAKIKELLKDKNVMAYINTK